ncbi:RNA-binding domain-containing protein [Mediterranea massiliensis]|uniref:RNA-binding domain-containing protein n=1 Tax=Mediterranea massiliensis TaxID=1841865 RepID=UPI0025A31274|nr:RNA-binding domain-containing protein [Mediterranea massiliensis]MDM8336920.1 ATP-binding protein [Mediterranea massiliensis]
MTKEEIFGLLKSTETSRIERTVSTTDMDKFQEAICAFSNDMSNSRQNGYLIIGAKDNGELSGLKVDDNLFKKISGIRSDGNILPIPMMTCERYELDGGDLLIVEVQPSFSTPVRYRGRTFIRIGPRRDIATIDEERILSEKRMSNMATFDASPCYSATLDDIYLDIIRNEYIPKAVNEEELKNDTRSIEQQMAALGLYDMTYHCPTNACIVLFGKNPRQFLYGAYLQYVRFNGLDRGAEIDDEKPFYDCLAKMMPYLEAFIDFGIIKSRPVAVSTLREKNQSNYPADALRELLLNACMHRDYQSNMPTRFYQFANRIEIMNPGGLYGKARPENFPDVNDYRNPIIAQALKVMGYVNMFNRGVSRVKNMMVENGGVEPVFNVDKITAFEVISYSAIEYSDSQYDNCGLPKSFPKSFPKSLDKLIPGYFGEEDKNSILLILNSLIEPKSAKELALIMSCSIRTVKDKYLEKMLQSEVIAMTIPDKPTSSRQKYKLIME